MCDGSCKWSAGSTCCQADDAYEYGVFLKWYQDQEFYPCYGGVTGTLAWAKKRIADLRALNPSRDREDYVLRRRIKPSQRRYQLDCDGGIEEWQTGSETILKWSYMCVTDTTKLIKDATLYTDAWRQGRSIPTVNVVPLVRDLRDALMAAEARVKELTEQRDEARSRDDSTPQNPRADGSYGWPNQEIRLWDYPDCAFSFDACPLDWDGWRDSTPKEIARAMRGTPSGECLGPDKGKECRCGKHNKQGLKVKFA